MGTGVVVEDSSLLGSGSCWALFWRGSMYGWRNGWIVYGPGQCEFGVQVATTVLEVAAGKFHG